MLFVIDVNNVLCNRFELYLLLHIGPGISSVTKDLAVLGGMFSC